MTASDSRTLAGLFGRRERAASTDDLQNLLLQVVLALLMVFMIAYFIFVENQKKARAEEVMALNRQKLTLALDKVAEARRVRYGLNALMTQGVDGRRTFEPDVHVRGGRIALSPAAEAAFAQGAKAAYADYADRKSLAAEWARTVVEEAELTKVTLDQETREWFYKAVETEVENVRLDARGVQRALAARLQKQWIDHPETLGEVKDAGEIAAELKNRSLKLVSEAIGSEVLP